MEQLNRQVLILKAAGWNRSSAALLNFAVQNMLEEVLPGAIAHIQKNGLSVLCSCRRTSRNSNIRWALRYPG